MVGSVLLTIICPLLIAYRSQGFWVKTNFYREQPKLNFNNELIIILRSNKPEEYWIWSTYPQLNALLQKRVRVASVRSREEDVNRDGKQDVFHLVASLPLAPGEQIHLVEMILIFHYHLDLYSRFRMQAMAHVKHESLLPGRQVQFTGDLKLHQNIPFYYRGVDARFNDPIIKSNNGKITDFNLDNILSEYSSRNVTTNVDRLNVQWKPAGQTQDDFIIDVKLTIREERIEYYTGFWEMIKFAWIQYLAILVVFVFVVSKIIDFVFRNRIVTTVPRKD